MRRSIPLRIAALLLLGTTSAAAQPLVISEFRLRGPSGANDEFVEILNASATAHTVAGGGTGYALAASNGVARCVIPNGTVIPARGHYLCTNSGAYSLGGYATGDATFTADIPDNAGIALFNTSVAANFALASRLDAVGATTEANTLYREGAGYPALTPFSIDYSFSRDECGKGGAITAFGQCPSGGATVDTGNNAADFIFNDTNGTSAGAGQRLGVPGPQNLASPRSGGTGALPFTRVDPTVAASASPNRVRDLTSAPASNGTFGTLDIRRRITNTTGAPVTRLRFRIVDLTTFPAPSGYADLRPRTSTDVVVSTAGGTVTVRGTTLEQPPNQPNGSGFNGSLTAASVTAAAPLAAGGTIDVRVVSGIQQTGRYKLGLLVESLPGGTSLFYLEGNTENEAEFDGTLTLTGAEGWRMLSAAYTTQTYGSLFGPLWTQGFPGADFAGGQPNVVLYAEATAGGQQLGYTAPTSQTAAFPSGRGVFAYVYADDDYATPGTQGGFPKTVTQAGTSALAPFSFAPTFTSSGSATDDGWNLLGNPFAGTMNWDAAGWTKTNLGNAFYVWDPNAAGGAQYLTWNGAAGSFGTGLIRANQGFWVKATAASPVLTAPNAALTTGGTLYGRDGGATVVGLRLSGTFGDVALGTSTVAAFLPGAATAHDALDAYELAPLTDTFLQLYAAGMDDDGVALDLVALPADLTSPVEIPLGARAFVAGQPAGAAVTLTWPELRNVPETWTVQIEDRQTGHVVDLRAATEYTFALSPEGLLAPETLVTAAGPALPAPLRVADAARSEGRLVLVVGPRVATAAEDEVPAVFALHAPQPNPVAGTALVGFDLAEATEARVELFDMLGRRVATLADGMLPAGQHTARLDASALPSGAYVLRMAAGRFSDVQRLTVVR